MIRNVAAVSESACEEAPGRCHCGELVAGPDGWLCARCYLLGCMSVPAACMVPLPRAEARASRSESTA
jgi:hypothetical protein